MSMQYTCGHHSTQHKAHGDIAHRICGCNGVVHYACLPALAPFGTARPAEWPVYLAWRTEEAHPDSPHQKMMDFLEESDRVINAQGNEN